MFCEKILCKLLRFVSLVITCYCVVIFSIKEKCVAFIQFDISAVFDRVNHPGQMLAYTHAVSVGGVVFLF